MSAIGHHGPPVERAKRTETIAIVGFGDMGEQMVPHLLSAGHQVRVADRDDSRIAAARQVGATIVASAAEAARGADVIFGLVMSQDIPTAYLGDGGVLAGVQPGASVPTLDMLREGYEIYPVFDAVGGVSAVSHQTAVDRMVQAEARPITSLAFGCELMRNWARVDANRYRAVIDDYFRRKRAAGQPSGELFSRDRHAAPDAAIEGTGA